MSFARSRIRDRLAHLEHEHLAAARERARADDELHRLRDRHEVARHRRVGDRDRAAGGDLAAEDRHHRARRAEHVAEAHARRTRVRDSARRPPRPPTRRAPWTRPSPSRARPPCRSRRGRTRCTPVSPATRAHHARGERVVAHRLDRVALHQRRRACRRRRGRRRSGGARANTSRIRSSSLQSASTATVLSAWRSSTSSRSISNRLSSAWSSSTSRAGPDARDLAAQLGADRAAGAGDEHARGRSGSRRRARSPSAPARGRGRPRPHLAHLAHELRRRSAAARTRSASCAPARRARGTRVTTRARSVPGADGIAISTSSGSTSSSTCAELVRWCRAPRARGRCARRCLRGSSSMKPTGR